MNDDEKINFLANIFHVGASDGKVSEKEIEAVAACAKNLGCSRSIITQSGKKSAEPGFTIKPVGLFSDRVANLEGMIYISIIDGLISPEEKSLILQFCKDININNEQLQIILAEAKRRAVRSDLLICSGCYAENSASAKFCANCGSPLAAGKAEKIVSLSYEIPLAGIAIEFAESTASGFVDAVLKAEKAPVNARCIKNKKSWYLAAWPLSEIANAISLIEDLKGMRNRKVWLDGKESRWDEIFGFVWCSQQRNSAYRPLEHCFGIDEKRLNIWGCKQSAMSWASWEHWFSYGKFIDFNSNTNEAVFVFDKSRIRHDLESNLYRIRLCPYLNVKLIENIFEIFPAEVEVSTTKKTEWRFKEDYEQSPGSVFISEKVADGGLIYTSEYYSSGVIPNGQSVGLKILKKALDKLGISSEDMQAVLECRDEN